MKSLFFDIETTIKIKLSSILDKLSQRHNRGEQADLDDGDNETCISTQILRMQKKQLINLKELLERYCNVLLIFGFNSAKNDLNLIKSFSLPVLVNESVIEPTVIKKAIQLIPFNLGDFQLLFIRNFPRGATSLGSFFKVYETSETKGFFPYEWLDHPRENADDRTSPLWCFLQ